jgi:thiosulfate/3-mercaptopyruvate sulfurtransferase
MPDHISTLISATEALAAQNATGASPLFVDCRFDLYDPEAGRRQYEQSHIPGSVHADLDADLSGPVGDGSRGRHPLPTPEAFGATLQAWGLHLGRFVIAYDAGPGMFASRLWWMLHWVGHPQAAVLDGGLHAWSQAGGTLTDAVSDADTGTFEPRANPAMVVDVQYVESLLGDASRLLVDARDHGRFTGAKSAFDPRSGHIPGAVNHPYQSNLDASGTMLSSEQLKIQFARSCSGGVNSETVMYCGSGVSACHNVLAAVHAGLPWPLLYPGSWSEWSSHPDRPMATGG